MADNGVSQQIGPISGPTVPTIREPAIEREFVLAVWKKGKKTYLTRVPKPDKIKNNGVVIE